MLNMKFLATILTAVCCSEIPAHSMPSSSHTEQEDRVEQVLRRLTLEQKIGQMILLTVYFLID